MQKRVLTLLAVSLLGLALVSGCGSSEKKEASTPQNKVIKIGATAGPHADVVHAVADEAKKQGINVEVSNSLIILRRTKPWRKVI